MNRKSFISKSSSSEYDVELKVGGPGSKFEFFRQSAWMIFATTASGLIMYSVHIIAKEMPRSEYGVFGAMLQLVNLLGIPAIGLQSVFAQEAASAMNEEHLKVLSGGMRWVLRWLFFIWVIVCLAALFFLPVIKANLKVENSMTLIFLLMATICILWIPVFQGVLQGQQNFFWFGLISILNAIARFVTVALAVLLFSAQSAGAMFGVFVGYLLAAFLGLWQTKRIWEVPPSSFDFRGWLYRVVPLTLGLGVCVFMLSVDMIIVQVFFDKNDTGAYMAAGMIGRGLVLFTIPVAAVMFPKVVWSHVRSVKTDATMLAVVSTLLLGTLAAVICTMMPWLPLWVVYQSKYLDITWLVPWFAWAMLPLAVANVMMNNLLARKQFGVVMPAVMLALGYLVVLLFYHTSFLVVVKVMGGFNLALLGITYGFSRLSNSKRKTDL